jgi:protein O-mannosyl-transferase
LPAAATKAQLAQPEPAGIFSSPGKQTVVLCLLLVAATLAVYNSVNRNAFVNFDDDPYITHNPHVITGLNRQTITWAFSHYYEANWHPLTWISHAVDWQLFGANPVGHHYTNVVLHAVNVVLLFLLLQSATGFTGRSLMVAALFAVHPVNVESVAWAAERKNVLSMFFLLLTMHAYGWYARKPDVRRYSLVALLFASGLMSKPQVITLPFLLLLWDYWPLGRFGRAGVLAGNDIRWNAVSRGLILEKVPLLMLSLASAIITTQAQKAGNAIRSVISYPFDLRLENAFVAYCRYIGKALWPAHLSPMYPHPQTVSPWQLIASVLFLSLITERVIDRRQRGYLITGWFWFLGALVPMIGLVQVGEQAMADRYAYLPFVGLFVMIVWGTAELAQARPIATRFLVPTAALVVAALSFLTYRQIGFWHDSETLWIHALKVNDTGNYKAHFNLAVIYDAEGRYDEAIRQFRAAENPREDDPRIHFGMGIYDQRHGHLQEAVDEYQAAVRLGSQATHEQSALAYLLLAGAQEKAGHVAEAAAARERAAGLTTNLDEVQRTADNLLK